VFDFLYIFRIEGMGKKNIEKMKKEEKTKKDEKISE
jgi:hypothetical protein